MINSALILCAGLGTRMKPLTNNLPKPMLKVAGKPLLFYHLEQLASIGIEQVVINTFWQGDKIVDAVKSGTQFGLHVKYSHESPLMETGGGIKQALPLIKDETFYVINGDIWCDMPLETVRLPDNDCVANLVMTSNPSHNPEGDFSIENDRLTLKKQDAKTFTGIAIYNKAFFTPVALKPGPLSPWFKYWIEQDKVRGQFFAGRWCDVGTPQRLTTIEKELTL